MKCTHCERDIKPGIGFAMHLRHTHGIKSKASYRREAAIARDRDAKASTSKTSKPHRLNGREYTREDPDAVKVVDFVSVIDVERQQHEDWLARIDEHIKLLQKVRTAVDRLWKFDVKSPEAKSAKSRALASTVSTGTQEATHGQTTQ